MRLADWDVPPSVEEVQSGVALSLAIGDVDSGETAYWRAYRVVPVASAAKVLLLGAVARAISRGDLSLDEPVPTAAEDRVGGTGVIARLRARPSWPVADLAYLVAAVSDNTATNALLRHLGFAAVEQAARAIGLPDLRIHDYVRDEREPGHPPAFSSGTARDLCRLMMRVARGELVDAAGSSRVLGWLAANEDHGLLCASLRHDPHDPDGEPLRVWNKTGRDVGVRADVGLIQGTRRLAYAALATCAPGAEWDAELVLRTVGAALGPLVSGGPADRSRG